MACRVIICDGCGTQFPHDFNMVGGKSGIIGMICERGWWSDFVEEGREASTELCPECKPKTVVLITMRANLAQRYARGEYSPVEVFERAGLRLLGGVGYSTRAVAGATSLEALRALLGPEFSVDTDYILKAFQEA